MQTGGSDSWKTTLWANFSDADLPCMQTVLNMADEGHFMSKLQIAENVLQSKDVTLHADGTTRDDNKMVGQQINLPSGATLGLGFVGVDTESSSTLLELTIYLLDELVRMKKRRPYSKVCWKR